MSDCADQPPGLGFRISSAFQRSTSRNYQAIKRPETRCSIYGKPWHVQRNGLRLAFQLYRTELALAGEHTASRDGSRTVSLDYSPAIARKAFGVNDSSARLISSSMCASSTLLSMMTGISSGTKPATR